MLQNLYFEAFNNLHILLIKVDEKIKKKFGKTGLNPNSKEFLRSSNFLVRIFGEVMSIKK
jgi:hypothetical protein